MIIDCHGHYTTSPPQLQKYRDGQIAGAKDPKYVATKGNLGITDDQIRESLEGAQLRIQRERGTGQIHAVEKQVELDVEDKTEDLVLRAPVVLRPSPAAP